MKGKLYKTGNEFLLQYEDGETLGITSGITDGRKLSIKNCEAIANGYDLDELSEKHYDVHIKRGHTEEDSLQRKIDFTLGFVSALEILGDKKFSVKDMEKLMFATIEFTEQKEGETYPFLKSFIQSLQQTEFDVELVMECCGNYSAPCKYNCEYGSKPLLDSDGCLILKRI